MIVGGTCERFLRSRERLTDKVVSQGKGSTWTQTQDLMSSLQTAVTDEFPLVELSESLPQQD